MSVCFFIIFPKDYKLHIHHQWNVVTSLTKLQENGTKQYDTQAEDEESLTKSAEISAERLTCFSSSVSYTENKECWSSFSGSMKWEPFTSAEVCPLLSSLRQIILYSEKNPAEPKSKSNISIWEWEKKRIEIWSLWDVKSQLQDFKIRLTLIVPFAHLFFFLNTVLSVGYFPIWIHSFPSPAVSVCSCQVMTSPSFMSQNWSTAALLLLKKREEKKTSVFSS